MAESSAALSMKKLQGKVAIVTGGASGIGETTAHLFAEHGARAVVIADIQDNKGQSVAAAIGSEIAAYCHCDVTDEEQVKSLVDWTVATYGQLDIMFSNAGIASRLEQSILDLDFSEFDRLFAVNARGVVACAKEAARAMVELRVKGSIVCIASVNSRKGVLATDYVMSKHALLGLVRSAGRQLGQHGIRVNAVSPFVVATPLMCELHGKRMSEEEVEKTYEPLIPLKGAALKAKNVADAVLFLASDDSALITGQDMVIDGGLLA
ncbi:(-)-isopiperitenol/(-)-carveol dehydrogenase, mitochondrial-like [Diospyros lotus]|uniref:(-)-isopiperitenol/(-)-carveol dehydrogenase, mitochondrial-like n=1 Tax=Diospyros lotus TaxID=55363 RepID=UPI00225575B0|nr:(-)-isopiperitenol/(-)-carveol dehydrogenase, mitochondrial-like [Diospyros lotus]